VSLSSKPSIESIKAKHLVDEAESANVLAYMECKLPYDQLIVVVVYTPTTIKNK
jgi:hypothetical protein